MTRMFVRVRDKDTGHEYDVREDAVTPAHEILSGREPAPRPRRAKHRVLLGGFVIAPTENQEG